MPRYDYDCLERVFPEEVHNKISRNLIGRLEEGRVISEISKSRKMGFYFVKVPRR